MSERERWVPMAQRLYEDDALTYQQPYGRNTWAGLSIRKQDKYIERAREYSGLLPEAVDPLVLLGLKSELNRVMDESEARQRQVASVRELLRDLPERERAYVAQALNGPERCRARSGGDTDAWCTWPAGHGRLSTPGMKRSYPIDHAAPGIVWNER